MSRTALSANAIRVMIAGVPRLTAGLVRQNALAHTDMTIVGECRQPDDLPAFIAAQGVDVIVTVRTSNGVPTSCQHALFDLGLPVVAILTDGGLEVYERRAVRGAAMDDLFDEIRKVAVRPSTD
jgi:hypothetical protein